MLLFGHASARHRWHIIGSTRHPATANLGCLPGSAWNGAPLTLLDANVRQRVARMTPKPGADAVFYIVAVDIATHAIPGKARGAVVVPIGPHPVGGNGPGPATRRRPRQEQEVNQCASCTTAAVQSQDTSPAARLYLPSAQVQGQGRRNLIRELSELSCSAQLA